MAAALERPDLLRDERFATRDLRIEHYGELSRVFADIIASKPRIHWMTALEAHDVPFAPVQSLADVLDDPQVRHLQTFYRQQHPTEGEIVAIHRPVLIDGAREECPLPAPTLGEHTEAVLAELGYDRDAIAELRQQHRSSDTPSRHHPRKRMIQSSPLLKQANGGDYWMPASRGHDSEGRKHKAMRTSTDRILTTHVGSLIRPAALQEVMRAKQAGQSYDRAAYEDCLRELVADVVRRQAEAGVDVISDGEYGKSISWNQYVVERLSGFELRAIPPGFRPGTPGADRTRFKEFYAELDAREPMANDKLVACVGPVKYVGQAIVQRDIDNFKAALARVKVDGSLHAGGGAIERAAGSQGRILQRAKRTGWRRSPKRCARSTG